MGCLPRSLDAVLASVRVRVRAGVVASDEANGLIVDSLSLGREWHRRVTEDQGVALSDIDEDGESIPSCSATCFLLRFIDDSDAIIRAGKMPAHAFARLIDATLPACLESEPRRTSHLPGNQRLLHNTSMG